MPQLLELLKKNLSIPATLKVVFSVTSILISKRLSIKTVVNIFMNKNTFNEMSETNDEGCHFKMKTLLA